MDALEQQALEHLPSSARALLSSHGGGGGSLTDGSSAAALDAEGKREGEGEGRIAAIADQGGQGAPLVAASRALARGEGEGQMGDEDLAAFPEGRLDESAQPLDLSAHNSWSRRYV